MNTIECEEAELLLSRNLDGDLGREETAELFCHLENCEMCRKTMAELGKIERTAKTFSDSFENEKPAKDFIASTMKKIKAEESKMAKGMLKDVSVKKQSLWTFSLPSGLIGAFATLLLFFLLQPTNEIQQSPVSRLLHHPVQFNSTNDKVNWEKEHNLKAGHTLHLTVTSKGSEPVYVKISSDAETEITMTFTGKNGKHEATHDLLVNGVHYTTIPKQEKGDQLLILNKDNVEVNVKISTGEQNNLESKIRNELQSL
jgi:hypothetical protein